MFQIQDHSLKKQVYLKDLFSSFIFCYLVYEVETLIVWKDLPRTNIL